MNDIQDNVKSFGVNQKDALDMNNLGKLTA